MAACGSDWDDLFDLHGGDDWDAWFASSTGGGGGRGRLLGDLRAAFVVELANAEFGELGAVEGTAEEATARRGNAAEHRSLAGDGAASPRATRLLWLEFRDGGGVLP